MGIVGGGNTSTGPDKPFRILIETEGGVLYSWGDATFIQENSTHTTTAIVNSINGCVDMEPHEYENAPYDVTPTDPNPAATFGAGANDWLTCEKTNQEAVGFTHTHTADTSDPLLRVKFYGSFVCQMLGLANDVWHYASGFNLSTTEENQSVFTGHVLADEISIRNRGYIHAGARWNGNITFDVSGSEEIDHGMCWVGAEDGEPLKKAGFIGWDPFITGSVVWVTDHVSASLIRSSGDVIALYTSDRKLKDNIEYIIDPVSKVKQLNGIEFEWNTSQSAYPPGTKDIGIIAQDLQKVYPELVSTGPHGYLGINGYGKLAGLLIEAIKEQSSEIDVLKQRISKLENSIG